MDKYNKGTALICVVWTIIVITVAVFGFLKRASIQPQKEILQFKPNTIFWYPYDYIGFKTSTDTFLICIDSIPKEWRVAFEVKKK